MRSKSNDRITPSFQRFTEYARVLGIQDTFVWDTEKGEPIGDPHKRLYALYLSGFNEAKGEGDCDRCKDIHF